ncbi:hypothetical protein LBMAG42_20010 [Deltaproteobacteria bacterium]|nr:hypothetical protein LBMAG42_20010 [Deltaproteobacteria bacterium]
MPEAYDGDPASARRKFERDKRDLHQLGLTLAYDAARNLYAPPVDSLRRRRLQLSGAEAAICRLALALAAADPRSPLQADAAGCLARLARAIAPGPAAPPPPVHLHHPTRDVEPDLPDQLRRLGTAIRRRLPVRFTYRREGGGPRRAREVEPWGLYARQGRWYVVGWDKGRVAQRTFRIVRMRQLQVEGLPDGAPRFERDPAFDLAATAARPPWDWNVHAPVEAVLRVGAEVADSVVRGLGGDARYEGGVVRRTVTNANALLVFAVERLPRVHPIAPAPLAEHWESRLKRIAERHP